MTLPRRIAILAAGAALAQYAVGTANVTFTDPDRGNHGRAAPAGVYVARAISAGRAASTRLVLVR